METQEKPKFQNHPEYANTAKQGLLKLKARDYDLLFQLFCEFEKSK